MYCFYSLSIEYVAKLRINVDGSVKTNAVSKR